MRTNEERQQLIHRRTLEIQREQQKKRERVISGSGIAACLMIIIGIGCLMPEVTKQASVSGAKTNYTTGMASMLGNYEALGYICMGILAFAAIIALSSIVIPPLAIARRLELISTFLPIFTLPTHAPLSGGDIILPSPRLFPNNSFNK